MHHKLALHTAILLCVTLFSYFWASDDLLSPYALQVCAVLFIVLIVSRRLLKPPSFRLAESTIATATVLLIVGSSGGIQSPLFFLNYFLLFALSLFLEPILPIILGGAFITYYLFLSPIYNSPIQFVELIAFPFMTPLAYFLGNLYQKNNNQKKELKNLSEKVEELEDELAENDLEKTFLRTQ